MISELQVILFLNGYSPTLLKAAYYVSQSLYVMVFVSLCFLIKDKGIRSGIWGASIIAVIYAINFELKHIFNLPRPSDSNLNLIDLESDNSFPSGHAALSFGASAITGRVILYIWALLISISRLILGVHYLRDIIAGALLGYAIGKIAEKYERQTVETLFGGEHAFETGRKLVHGLFGAAVAVFVYLVPKDIAVQILILSIVIAFVISWAIKKRIKLYLVDWIICAFERKKDIMNFPLKGTIFFLLGALVAALVYRTDIAATAIMILALGDCFSTLVGKPFGRIRHLHNLRKSVEGSVAGFFAALFGALFFEPVRIAVIGSFAGILVESFSLKIFGVEIDDNLSIPVICGGVMTAIILAGL